METMTLASRNDKRKTPETGTFRFMTADEAKHLVSGGTCYVIDQRGRFASVKINGTPKTWKTRPYDVDVPWKYGLYEFGREEFRADRPTTLLLCRID